MKIAYGSDLHLELEIPRPDLAPVRDADVLILAGDIFKGRCKETGLPQLMKYSKACQRELDIPVIVVCGNHELYDEEIGQYLDECRAIADATEGLYFLENDALDIGGVRFLGCTLWSDFAMAEDAQVAKEAAQKIIYDYRRIKLANGSDEARAISPDDTIRWNAASREFLSRSIAAESAPTVVVTHFPPVPMSDPKFADSPLTPYFNNDWAADIEAGVLAPDIWVAGHTHYMEEQTIGRTRICSRQGGYPGELGPFSWGLVTL